MGRCDRTDFDGGGREEMTSLPRFMSIHEVAKTGILPERCLRKMAKEGRLPAIKTGNKTLINFDRLVELLNGLGGETA